MSSFGLDLTEVLLQLQAAVPYFSRAQGVFISDCVDLPTAEEQTYFHSLPQAWVIPDDDSPEDNQTASGEVDQAMWDQFSVLVAIDASPNEYGSAYRNLNLIRAQICTAILGWTPEGCEGPIEYAGGSLTSVSKAIIMKQFRFKVPVRIGYDEGRQVGTYPSLKSVLIKYLFNRDLQGAARFTTAEPVPTAAGEHWLSLVAGTGSVTGQVVTALTAYEWTPTQPVGSRWVAMAWDGESLVTVQGA